MEVDAGRAVFEMEAGPQHANPMGTLHGGILCDIADAAMGIAYASTLGEGESFTTLELKINFFKPVWPREARRAQGRIVKRGRTVGMAECDVFDETGSLVATRLEHVHDASGRRWRRKGSSDHPRSTVGYSRFGSSALTFPSYSDSRSVAASSPAGLGVPGS